MIGRYDLCDFIDGDAFENLALKYPTQVVYRKTDEILKASIAGVCVWDADKVLVTHNSDYAVTDTLVAHVLNNPKHLPPIHWFAQNCATNHKKLTPIPIGLERIRWFPHLRKREVLLSYTHKAAQQPTKLSLANFSLATNQTTRSICAKVSESFSTQNYKTSVQSDAYGAYLSSILDHRFVLCPEGNGMDTHRLWETLYLGRVPVLVRSPSVSYFSDLPLLVVDRWEHLTLETLLNYVNDYERPPSYSMLFFSFWEKLVTEKITSKTAT